MVKLPGLQRLRDFMDEWKRDFAVLQSPSSQARQRRYSIYLESLKDNHDLLGESSTSLVTRKPAIIDSPQPMSELLSPPLLCFGWGP